MISRSRSYFESRSRCSALVIFLANRGSPNRGSPECLPCRIFLMRANAVSPECSPRAPLEALSPPEKFLAVEFKGRCCNAPTLAFQTLAFQQSCRAKRIKPAHCSHFKKYAALVRTLCPLLIRVPMLASCIVLRLDLKLGLAVRSLTTRLRVHERC